jgi:predicted ribosome quality control (RQC) complex YloA/Tae2 family protein
VGRSAKDNLSLLRAAKPWDIWLHVKDVPGCYGLLRRNKNQEIPEALLQEAARKVVDFSLKAKRTLREGERFEVLVAECRYVRPIKGDHIGRVRYSNERVLSCKL